MRARRFISSLLVLFAGVGMALAQLSDAQAPDPTQALNASALVRLSFVQGQVSILQGAAIQFDQAQANMPLLAGNTLATGENGQAEVEFTDGSVARLTPKSQLRLMRLPSGNARNGETELELLSGLGYFELNTVYGQHYTVHFGAGIAQPTDNSIFRLGLDDAPELAVFVGTVHAHADGGFDQAVNEGQSLHFPPDDASNATVEANIRQDSWDQWNQDRDDLIAQQSQQQTSAREQSGASNEPGWDDLDAYGNWYPTEDEGNVWVPDNVPVGWDPFSSGYWANYPGWGATWISAYPWGWLPYHCGAWNYRNSFGWGWAPGQCGLGWQPIVTIRNAPRNFRYPPRPLPGGHIGVATTGGLSAVNRGPALPSNGFLGNNHTRPIRVDGQRLDPLPVLRDPTLGGRSSYQATGHIGAATPVGRSYGNGPVLAPRQGLHPGTQNGISSGNPNGTPGAMRPPIENRPVYRAAPQPQASPRGTPPAQPRMSAPPPHMSAPAPRMSAPAPRMSAPAPRMSAPAPHPSAPPAAHR